MNTRRILETTGSTKLGGIEKFEKFLQDGVLENLSSSGTGQPTSLPDSIPGKKLKSVLPPSQVPAAPETGSAKTGATFNGNIADATSKINSIKGGEIEMVLYEKVSLRTGSRANNAWLQEVSDPISKATWDNYAMISPQMGKSLFGIDIYNKRDSDKYEVNVQKPVIKITVNGKSIELPILIIPGTHPNVIAMAVGYGRQSSNKDKTAEFIGPAANGPA